jgi:DNA polymerase-1
MLREGNMEYEQKPIALIVDGHNLLYASFFGMPDRIKALDGRSVQGVYGFVASLLKMIQRFVPEVVAVCFDAEQETFRHELFSGYKANRPVLTDDTNPFTQYADIIRALEFLGIASIEKAGFEADDLIGSLASKLAGLVQVYIASMDRDLLQLIGDDITIYSRSRGEEKIYDVKEVVRKYGVLPSQFVDYRVLVGDRSDNIAGVPGIGPKTAASLLRQFGSLQGIYDNLQLLTPRISSVLAKYRDDVVNHRELLTIRTDVSMDININEIYLVDKDRILAMTVRYVMGELGLFPNMPHQSLLPGLY